MLWNRLLPNFKFSPQSWLGVASSSFALSSHLDSFSFSIYCQLKWEKSCWSLMSNQRWVSASRCGCSTDSFNALLNFPTCCPPSIASGVPPITLPQRITQLNYCSLDFKQTDRQTDKQTERQTDMQMNGQRDWPNGFSSGQLDKRQDRRTYSHPHWKFELETCLT